MGLPEIEILNSQMENKMVDRDNTFTPTNLFIPIIGLQTGSRLNLVIIKTTFCANNLLEIHNH